MIKHIDECKTYHVTVEGHSYGIFCLNSVGDLFLSGDWGMYGFSWRSFGNRPFKEFVAQINGEYLFGKFEINHRYLNGKGLPKHVRPHVIALFDELKVQLKSEI